MGSKSGSSISRMTEFWTRTKTSILSLPEKEQEVDDSEPFVTVDAIKKIGERLKHNIVKFGAAGSTLKPHETDLATGMMSEVETIWLAGKKSSKIKIFPNQQFE